MGSLLLKIKNEGGEVLADDDYLELKGVQKATFYIVSNSSFYHEDYSIQNEKDLAAVYSQDFEDLLKKHQDDYHSLYKRVELNLA